MATLNVTTTSDTLALLTDVGSNDGSEGGHSDTSNITVWSDLGASMLSFKNITEEFDLLANTNGSSGGHVPYNQRLETYLVPFLFAVIFIVGVIGEWFSFTCNLFFL